MMKQRIVLFIAFTLCSAAVLQAQSLKDLLYGGKLKSDTGSVVRKSDDLSTKIDTSTRKPAPPPQAAPVVEITPEGDTVVTLVGYKKDGFPEEPGTEAPAVAPRDNDEVWKEYTDSLISELRQEVMPNRKIKPGTYSVLIVYEIDLDGSININTVSASPANDFLTDQVRNRMTITAPTLQPLLNQYGKPRKAIKRQTITLSK